MKRRRSHVGCLFWIALILLAVVIFVFNRGRFENALKSVGVSNLVTLNATKKPTASGGASAPTSTPVPPIPRGTTRLRTPPATSGPSATSQPPQPGGAAQPGSAPSATATRAIHGGQGSSPGAVVSAQPQVTAPVERSQQAERSRSFDLYYVQVDAHGATELKQVNRQIVYVDSPLTDTIRSLLSDSSGGDNKGALISLIPSGTKLLDASVKDGTAYLNFNDRLRFNAFGADGYRVALQQLVFTATQFPTVQRVQVLIDGRVHQYLGPEGMAIDEPLDRGSFVSASGQPS